MDEFDFRAYNRYLPIKVSFQDALCQNKKKFSNLENPAYKKNQGEKNQEQPTFFFKKKKKTKKENFRKNQEKLGREKN